MVKIVTKLALLCAVLVNEIIAECPLNFNVEQECFAGARDDNKININFNKDAYKCVSVMKECYEEDTLDSLKIAVMIYKNETINRLCGYVYNLIASWTQEQREFYGDSPKRVFQGCLLFGTFAYYGSLAETRLKAKEAEQVEQAKQRQEQQKRDRYSQCNQGNASACFDIGYDKWQECSDIDCDQTEALTYYSKACDLKDEVGCFNVGAILESNLFYRNPSQAQTYYRKACNMGYQPACFKVK